MSKTEGKGTVNITTANQLENYSKGEEQEMETLIKGVAEAGANVVISSQTLSDIALHYVEKYKVFYFSFLFMMKTTDIRPSS